MYISRFTWAFLANQAAFILADPIGALTVQGSDTPAVAGAGFCQGADLPPIAYLDNATFYGVCNGQTAKFLGIPYAQPP